MEIHTTHKIYFFIRTAKGQTKIIFKTLTFYKLLGTRSSLFKVIDIKAILVWNLLIYIHLHYVWSLLWCAATLAILDYLWLKALSFWKQKLFQGSRFSTFWSKNAGLEVKSFYKFSSTLLLFSINAELSIWVKYISP